ncbi:MAG: hypothetical protein Q7R73_01785 [bacterium]|nr:hypothetical protein [bacterium]
MQDEEKLRFAGEITATIKNLQQALINFINDLGTNEETTNALRQALDHWEEKRQLVNSKGIGIILKPIFEVITFSLTGDEKRDVGQKTQNKSIEGMFTEKDLKFLKELGIRWENKDA